jgi:hypothetical protein
MSLSTLSLALFLALHSLHLGLAMQLPLVTWIGGGAALLASLRLVTVERPTRGLVFVLLAVGAIGGSQVLEDWAVEGSWPQTSGLSAGLVLALLSYQLWLFAARAKTNSEVVLDSDTQTILALGLPLTLLISPPESTVVFLFGTPVALITVGILLLASIALLADRCAGLLMSRLALLLPLALLTPVVTVLLESGQGPIIEALGDLLPTPRQRTRTGFSPYQQLSPSVFLRPTNRAVMRIETDSLPSAYLVGNRLVRLDEDLRWQPSNRRQDSPVVPDAEGLTTGEWRYEIDNHHFSRGTTTRKSLVVRSLSNDNYIFVSPGTRHVTGRFAAMVESVAGVWTVAFERGADRRWQFESGGDPLPDSIDEENLELPGFWDAALQAKSSGFVAPRRQQTVDNLLLHFRGRRYSLRTDFDSKKPFHDFFLNDKAGYCFWFATATTLALRANGIPSRLVGGYAIHERLSSRLYLVRQRDAHSWVEWQDKSGYWHTIDPTPATIVTFFDGYGSSILSNWYHNLAGHWEILIDSILADALMANLVRYGGLLILVFLFIREYRRIRGEQAMVDGRSLQWQQLWQRFLSMSNLPTQASWTVLTYVDNLPADWPSERKSAVRKFLEVYNLLRFSDHDGQAVRTVEKALQECSEAIRSQ